MNQSILFRLFPLLSHLFCPLMLCLDGGDAGAGGGSGAGAGAGAAAGDAGAGSGSGAGQGTGDAGKAAGGAGNGQGAGAAAAGQSGPILDAQGLFTKGWAKALGAPDSLEAKFTDPKALVGSYVNLEKLISAKGIIKPGANATPAEISAYHQALGAPATPAEYGLAKPDTIKVDGKDVPIPAELWNKDDAATASTLFHQLGLTKEQAQALTQFDLQRGLRDKSSFAAMVQKIHDDGVAALKADWKGTAYDQNVKLANDAAAKLGLTPDVLKANPDLANNPLFIRALAKAGEMVLEKPAAGLRGQGSSSLNPAAEIQAIMNDPAHPWHPHNANKNPAAHQAAVKHMTDLFKMKNPESA